LADVLQRDPALSARVLRLANSAYFRLARPVTEVRAACIVLGFDTVRALAVGLSALDTLSKSVGSALDLDAFWRHSVAVATAAQGITRRAGLEDPGTAFCAGVLHDVGKLLLASVDPDRWRRAAATGGLEAERAEFGTDHAEVGAWIGERWHFPPEIVEAIGGHHAPAGGAGRWGVVLRLADGVAQRAGCRSPGSGPADAADPALLARLPITPDELAVVERDFASSLERVQSFADLARGA
jgi:putative nucleotidyltransferase with HDIG domain